MKAKVLFPTTPITSNIEGIETVSEFIAYCARVSNPSNQMNTETSERLLNYLIRNKHFSPFEMMNMVVEVETTRDIARQLLRHRSFTFQEYSQRYADPNDMGETFEYSEARLQDTKNRQNSVEIDDEQLQKWWQMQQKDLAERARYVYSQAITKGIAKEVARKVLPEGLTKSRLIVNGTIRSWIHYIELRSGNGTQKEHMELAKAIATAISAYFPQIENYVQKETRVVQEKKSISQWVSTVRRYWAL